MTAKDKAKELVDKFKNGLWKDRGISIYSEDAIYCALIAVDQMISVLPFTDINTSLGKYCESERNYLNEVKKEIEQL